MSFEACQARVLFKEASQPNLKQMKGSIPGADPKKLGSKIGSSVIKKTPKSQVPTPAKILSAVEVSSQQGKVGSFFSGFFGTKNTERPDSGKTDGSNDSIELTQV